VGLHLAALLAREAFQLAPGGIEGVADRHVDIFMGVILVLVATHHHLPGGDGEIDVNLIELAFVVVLVGCLHRYLTRHNVAETMVQLVHFFTDDGLYGRRRGHVTEGDLERQLHSLSPLQFY